MTPDTPVHCWAGPAVHNVCHVQMCITYNKYVPLKHLLLQNYSLSATERADRIPSLSSLGNGTVVDLMDNMLSLLGSDECSIYPPCFWPPVTTKVRLKRPIGSCWLLDSSLSRLSRHPSLQTISGNADLAVIAGVTASPSAC